MMIIDEGDCLLMVSAVFLDSICLISQKNGSNNLHGS